MQATTLERTTPPAMQATMLPTPASVNLSIMVCSVSSKQHVWTPSNPCNKENIVWTTLLHHYDLLKSVMAERHLVYRCSFSPVNFLCKENCPSIMLQMPESKCLKQGRKIQMSRWPLVSDLYLICWEGGTGFLNKSHSTVKQKQHSQGLLSTFILTFYTSKNSMHIFHTAITPFP